MEENECKMCMLAELRSLVERLGSSKTDEEAEKIQDMATELMSTCRLKNKDDQEKKWQEIRPELEKLKELRPSASE
jgi:hypothetical protein